MVTWERTVIGGRIAPEDSRVMRLASQSAAPTGTNPADGTRPSAHGPDVNWPTNSPTTGTADTKQAVADMVRQSVRSVPAAVPQAECNSYTTCCAHSLGVPFGVRRDSDHLVVWVGLACGLASTALIMFLLWVPLN